MPIALDHALKMLTVHIQSQQTTAVRTESFLGREFAVIPAVFVRSQVLHNNLGACALPASSINDLWAQGWNGIPVLVGPHPTLRGVPTSGRNPALWNERCVGWMFNVRSENDGNSTRRLAGEVWIDVTRAEAVEGGAAVLARVWSGRPVELSTGFATDATQQAGVLNGTTYEIVLQPGDPDHLVISTEMTGACSVQDGCGLGVNKYQGERPMPGEKPVETVSMNSGASLWSKVKERLGMQRSQADAAIEARLQSDLAVHEALPVSDQQRSDRIRKALQDQYQGRGDVCVSDVYTQDGSVVWWMMTPLGPEPPGSEYFRSTYTEDASSGAFTFGEPERVRRVSGYEPVGNSTEVQGEQATNCGCTTAQPSGNNQSEDDMNQQEMEKAINDLTANMGNLVASVNGLVGEVTTLKGAVNEKSESATISGLKKGMAEIAEQVNNLGTVAKSAVDEQERERKDLVSQLAGNFRCQFNEEELNGMSRASLQKLSDSLSTNFSGRGGPRSTGNGGDGQTLAFMPPRPYFEKDKAAAAGGE